MNGYPNESSATTLSSKTASEARHVLSKEEAEYLDKTLNVLAGRAEELRERLGGVLSPSMPANSGSTAQQKVEPTGSQLTATLRVWRSIAESAIGTIDDILQRLDV